MFHPILMTIWSIFKAGQEPKMKGRIGGIQRRCGMRVGGLVSYYQQFLVKKALF